MILQKIFQNLAKQGDISPDVLCQNASVVNITQLDLSNIIPGNRTLLIGDDTFDYESLIKSREDALEKKRNIQKQRNEKSDAELNAIINEKFLSK